jgi:hypothetical protein
MHVFFDYFLVLFRERFAFPLPFSDGHGKLALSAKQRQKLTRWARPEEFIREPTMIHLGKQKPGLYHSSTSDINRDIFLGRIRIRNNHPDMDWKIIQIFIGSETGSDLIDIFDIFDIFIIFANFVHKSDLIRRWILRYIYVYISLE